MSRLLATEGPLIGMDRAPVSVLIPTKNEERNLLRCLDSLRDWAGEIIVVDSQSTDRTVEIATSAGANVIQFEYGGGWPKKRQWALDSYGFKHDWILLLDADEVLTDAVKREIRERVSGDGHEGYFLGSDMVFLGRRMRFGGFRLYKLNLFRRGRGRFERRFEHHTTEMSDIEIDEHVIVQGPTARLRNRMEHHNVNDLSRFIAKHNDYSTWEAELLYEMKHGNGTGPGALEPRLVGGSQAQRRRWFKTKLIFLPGFSFWFFCYRYIVRGSFLDGRSGLVYCAVQAMKEFQAKAKLRELEIARRQGKGKVAP